MGRQQQLAKNYVKLAADARERERALRLQAMAWRQLAMIALVDREKARREAQWLLFRTVPWVDGEAVQKFVTENLELAERCGVEAGVFTAATEPSAVASA